MAIFEVGRLERDAAEMVWCRRTPLPPEAALEAGTGGGDMVCPVCEDIRLD